jgi:glycosyltransferase involved in cell wall biosynthesis
VKFSILTPSYNYARYLTHAIRSVEEQGPATEHIIMDGGSTDGTQALLRDAPPSVIWRSEPDGGQSDALNKALSLSTGDIIGWLNADDYYRPAALELVANIFARHPEVDVVHGDCMFVNGEGRFLRLGAGYPTPLRVLKNRGCVIYSTSTFFRREALGEAPWDTDLRVVMDWDLFLNLMSNGRRFLHVAQPLACFRMHEAQVTHELSDRLSAEHATLRRRWNASPSHPVRAQRLGDFEHRARKLVTGASLRELRAIRARQEATADS